MPKKVKITRDLGELKEFISMQIELCKSGELKPAELTAITKACDSIARIHEIEEVQKELVKLQKMVVQGRGLAELPGDAKYIDADIADEGEVIN